MPYYAGHGYNLAGHPERAEMQPSADQQTTDGALRARLPIGDVPDGPDRPTFGPFSTTQYRLLLSGMLSQGHGVQALCLFLSLTRDVLLDLIVHLDLPMPHDRPLRKVGGVRAWQAADFPVFLTGWLGNWSAACLADRFGRSKGSIWCKARRMGLPRRDRAALFWPNDLEQSPALPPPELPARPHGARPRKRYPERWLVKGTDKKIELTSQRNGLEVNWAANVDALIEMGWRHWSGQRLSRIAEDFGVSYTAIASQLYWLDSQGPSSRAEWTDTFDRARGEANARKAQYKLAYSKSDTRFPYFSYKSSHSRRDKAVGFYDVGFNF
jgi:hypothetical protein